MDTVRELLPGPVLMLLPVMPPIVGLVVGSVADLFKLSRRRPVRTPTRPAHEPVTVVRAINPHER